MKFLLDQSEHYIEALQKQLERPLPGKDVQAEMAPQGRSLKPPATRVSPRTSAVLLPLTRTEQRDLALVFTVRREDLSHHGGEISFPGGAAEFGDENCVDTALREAYEEIRLLPDTVEILGELTTLYIPPSHYLVHPIIGWIPNYPSLRPNCSEVDQILTIPFERLLAPESIREEQWTLSGRTMTVPFYEVEGHVIWGATAMILREFLVLAEQTWAGLQNG